MGVAAARNLARLCLRRIRTPTVSHAEYEARWRRILDDAEWKRCGTLEDFLFNTKRDPHLALVDSALVHTSSTEYRRFRHRKVFDTLARFVPPESELVELGSGMGGNLFGLAHHQAPWKLTGLELSPAGILCGQSIAATYGLPIRFEQIDLLDSGNLAWQRIRGRYVFTYYCLEQLPHHTEAVLANILKAGPRMVIHIEPAYELLKPWKPLDAVTWLYIRSRDYQRSLLSTLRAMPVTIREASLLRYASSAQHFPMVVVWAPK